MPAVHIRPTCERDREARAAIVHEAWRIAYSHIFSPDEIASVFDGSAAMDGDWTGRRERDAGTLVAEVGGRVAGMAGMALLTGGDGELAALYVLPEQQGMGVGSALWAAALVHLRGLGITRMEVWTLARSDARRFYEARGCRYFAAGTFRIGTHSENATGYEVLLPAGAPARRTDPPSAVEPRL